MRTTHKYCLISLLLATTVAARWDVVDDTPDSLVFAQWNGESWVAQYEELYTYTSWGALSDTTRNVYLLSTWLPDRRTLVTHAANEKRTELIRQLAQEMGWDNIWRRTYDYDEWDQLTTRVYYRYENGGWEAQQRQLRSYDGTGRLTDEISQSSAGSTWYNDTRMVMTYNATDQASQILYQFWNYDDGLWVDAHREQFTYNAKGDQSHWLSQEYELAAWKSVEQTIWEYDTQGTLLSKTTQWPLGESWLNFHRQVYEFDSSGQVQSVTAQLWDYDETDWYDDKRDLYIYDEQGRLTTCLEQKWLMDSLIWENDERYSWSYPSISSIDPLTPQAFKLEPNYPNPFNPSTTIRFSLEEPAQVTLSIFNLRGEEVSRLLDGDISAGQHRVVWDGRNKAFKNVESGLYVCRLESKGRSNTIKMLLLR